MMMKLYTLISLSLVVAISNAQSNLYNINNNDINDNNNDNEQRHTHKLALHNHKTLINSRYTNHASNISNRRLKNRNNNNNEQSKREVKPNKRNKREDTKIGDDIALAIADDYDRKYDSNKRAQRNKNELAVAGGIGDVEDVKRRHKDKSKEDSHEIEVVPDDAIHPKKVSKYTSQEILDMKKQKKKKKRTVQHTAQSTKHTPEEHQKKQKRGVNNEMINIFQNRISNINGSKQYKEDIAGGMSLDYTIPSDMSIGKHAKQTKRHSKSIKSVKSKVDKRPTMSPTESASPTPTLESASPTPTSSSESPTPTSSSESPTMDESCELLPGQDDPCPGKSTSVLFLSCEFMCSI